MEEIKMVEIQELGIGNSGRTLESKSLSKRDIKQEIYKRMEKGKHIGYDDVKKDDEFLHKEILGKYGTYYNLYKEIRMTGDKVFVANKPTPKKVIRSWNKDKVKKEYLKRYNEGLGMRMDEIQKDDSGLSNAISRYFGGMGNLRRVLEKEGLIPKRRIKWTKEKVKRKYLKRKEQGLSLRSQDIQKDDVPLYAAVQRLYGGFKNLNEQLGIKDLRGKKIKGKNKFTWDYEKVKKEYYRRYKNGEKLDSSLINAIYRHTDGVTSLKKELGIPVKGKKVKKKIRKYETKEQVKEGYKEYLEEGNKDSTTTIQKTNYRLLEAVYKHFNGIQDLRNEIEQDRNKEEDKTVNKNKGDKDMSEEMAEYRVNQTKDTEEGVTITIKNSEKLKNLTVDGSLKNINLVIQ